jgi:hypothetical protein
MAGSLEDDDGRRRRLAGEASEFVDLVRAALELFESTPQS